MAFHGKTIPRKYYIYVEIFSEACIINRAFQEKNSLQKVYLLKRWVLSGPKPTRFFTVAESVYMYVA